MSWRLRDVITIIILVAWRHHVHHVHCHGHDHHPRHFNSINPSRLAMFSSANTILSHIGVGVGVGVCVGVSDECLVFSKLFILIEFWTFGFSGKASKLRPQPDLIFLNFYTTQVFGELFYATKNPQVLVIIGRLCESSTYEYTHNLTCNYNVKSMSNC